ncbi:CBL-interacting serine/threonine-protein kinase 7-like [Andrographis paniculata]|uniref:CBL-interacting serine/threonine-protein kinase 7-like n=1 Tax=Andrographis paniculata TaxID=175694 RepID=UPI0021E8760C|nr:CBL-interacting serine/threonine-protein kinase 7-like [Andrographis paniculata]
MGPPPAAATLRRSATAGGSGSVILNKYLLGRLLGRGSFAKVYLARLLQDAGADAEVAVKVIDKAATVDAAMEPRILREVSAMRRLHHHPNILKLHEVMATKSKIYLVMELAAGGELFARLNRSGGRFSEPTARRYFRQVVAGLRFCHQNGVYHRDVKPQNLLLDENGVVKITDFGLSALSENQNSNSLIHTACGTPAYTAPEVVCGGAGGGGYDGEKADAWSCGVLLYVFLVGNLPFDDSNLSSMYRAMHRRAFEFPGGISKPAKLAIYRLLDPNPATRLSLDELTKLSWFKKSNSQINLIQNPNPNSDPNWGFNNYVPKATAFDIISMSAGLDLSGLFDGGGRKEIRFTTATAGIEEVVARAGEELGYGVERGGKGVGLRMVKGGRVVLEVEVWEVAVELWLVEMRVVDGGGVEFGELQWAEMRSGIGGAVVTWCTGEEEEGGLI